MYFQKQTVKSDKLNKSKDGGESGNEVQYYFCFPVTYSINAGLRCESKNYAKFIPVFAKD